MKKLYKAEGVEMGERIYLAFAAIVGVAFLVTAGYLSYIPLTNDPTGQPPEIESYTVAVDTGHLAGDDTPATEHAQIDGEPQQVFTMTAYCACEKCCGKWSDGYTATGTKATEGRTIAVDPTVIPYGSTVVAYYDDGALATYIAEDCGGGIKGNHIDVYFENHQAALEFGKQRAQIRIEGVE